MNRLISIAIVTTLGIISLSAQASSITIDFEEFNIGDGGGVDIGPFAPPGQPSSLITSQGYTFSGNGASDSNPYMSAEIVTGTNTGGTHAYRGSVGGYGQDGYNFSANISLRKTDGGAFAIHSLDLFMNSNGSTEIFGRSGDTGLFVNLDGVAVGTGGWLNLQSVSFKAEGDGFGPGFGIVEVDNITVSAVPIPAAAWLFGSALVGLGWMRRTQTV
jgi:hypothetical protein